MRARFLQRPNRAEEPCACACFELDRHKVPQSYSRAGEYARSLADFGMTFYKKCRSMQGEELT
jgi:hypothetical protein